MLVWLFGIVRSAVAHPAAAEQMRKRLNLIVVVFALDSQVYFAVKAGRSPRWCRQWSMQTTSAAMPNRSAMMGREIDQQIGFGQGGEFARPVSPPFRASRGVT
jgi:hypothetical protein